jgi:TRAP-type uncharacterized transport system substrate-binding protein
VKALVRRNPVLSATLAAILACVCLVWAILVVGRPLPSRTVVMTTGPDGEAYREYGEMYRAALAKEGLRLRLVPSAGDVENLARLADPASGVSIGFVASGLVHTNDTKGIVSLGTISYDPLWIFCRGIPGSIEFKDVRGKRVSIGPDGGGTHAVMREAFRVNGLANAVTTFPFAPREGGEALLRGEIDCACMLTTADAPIVGKLLADENISLVTSPRADAYVARYPYLRKVTVPRGVGDLVKDRPPQDVTLLAPMTSLLVREDLHPAIQYLLLEAASDIHSRQDIFSKPGQFPAAEAVEFPLSREVRSYHRSGGSFLQRNLPFWLAVLAERLLIVLIPLVGVVYPLLRGIPAALNWAVELRLSRLYTELLEIEGAVLTGADGAREALADLDRRVNAVRVPRAQVKLLYTLKEHIALVRTRLGTTGAAESRDFS